LERSIGWIQLLLAELKDKTSGPNDNIDEAENTADPSLPPIIVPLLGGCDPRAREEFSRSLTERQDPIDAIRLGGLKRLDDGVFGYAVEMVDLPTNILRDIALERESAPNAFTELLEASLTPLTSSKIRIAHTAPSPHAILQLTLKFGFDLFDVPWATEAADLGIALDLQFPVKEGNDENQAIGLNLFDEQFELDLLPLGGADSAKESWPCAPTYEDDKILHGGLDGEQWDDSARETSSTVGQPFTRAYIHHLLHTHEMSAYALLHLHNLAVMHAFFKGIRSQVLNDGKEGFRKEVLRFHKKYELPERLFEGARARWKEVELARGKGRLKREREAAANLSDAEMTNVDAIAVAKGIEDTP
jgi:queuine/archaeosine tRNA-ribosyltransferase